MAFEKQHSHRLALQKNIVCPCGHRPLQSVMIAPSLVRELKDPNILNIWLWAFEELRIADYWIFIGYSMPTEDIDIRELSLRALHCREKWPTIEVYQLKSPETKAR